MKELIRKITSLPEVLHVQTKITSARRMAMELYKSGQITEQQFETLLGGFGNQTINIDHVTIDNSIDNSTDNSVNNTGTLWNYQNNKVTFDKREEDAWKRRLEV